MKMSKKIRISWMTPQVIPWLILMVTVTILPNPMLRGQNSATGDNIWKRGVYVSPLAAIDGRREINIGYEQRLTNVMYLDIGIGYRYQYPNDPKLTLFETKEFKDIIRKDCYTNYTLWIIPTGGNCDNIDATDYYWTNVDDYLRFDISTKFRIKHFLDSEQGMGAAFLKWGLQLGYRSYDEYYDTRSFVYEDKRVVSSHQEGNDVEGTRYYTYEMKEYSYGKLSKTTVNEPYILPEIGLGYRIKVAKKITLEISGTANYGLKYKGRSFKKGFHAYGDVQLTYWF